MNRLTATREIRTLLVLLVATVAACSEWIPTSVLAPADRPVTHFPPVPFPALSKPGTIYIESGANYSVARVPTVSRYVLYDDGTHALQFASFPKAMEFTGHWTRSDSTVVFEWDGWSTAGPWGATATVRGDQLVVKYNLVMMLTDFVDATYVLVQDGL